MEEAVEEVARERRAVVVSEQSGELWGADDRVIELYVRQRGEGGQGVAVEREENGLGTPHALKCTRMRMGKNYTTFGKKLQQSHGLRAQHRSNRGGQSLVRPYLRYIAWPAMQKSRTKVLCRSSQNSPG